MTLNDKLTGGRARPFKRLVRRKDSEMASSAVDPVEAEHLRKRRPAPCVGACEAQAYQIEIRRLKSVLINESAELARMLSHDDITDSLHRNVVWIIERMRASGFDGA